MAKYVRKIDERFIVEDIVGYTPKESCLIPSNIDPSDYPFLKIVEHFDENMQANVKSIEVDEVLKADNPTLGTNVSGDQ